MKAKKLSSFSNVVDLFVKKTLRQFFYFFLLLGISLFILRGLYFENQSKQIIKALESSVSYLISINDSFQIQRIIESFRTEFGLSLIKIEERDEHSGEIIRKWYTSDVVNSKNENYPTIFSNNVNSNFQLKNNQSKTSIVVSFSRKLPVGWFFFEFILFALVLLFIFIYLVAKFKNLSNEVVSPINDINKYIEQPDNYIMDSNNTVLEVNRMLTLLKQYKEKIYDDSKKIEKLKIQSEKNKLAAQVAHDIRSPLTALYFIIHDLENIDLEKKELIDTSLNRIKDIADDLLQENRMENTDKDLNVKPQSIIPIIDQIISEANLHVRSKNITIEYNVSLSHNDLFVNVSNSEMSRSLSNVINNSVESIPKNSQGTIIVNIFDNEFGINILVKDNGRGIPEGIIPKLMNKGATFGKTSGSGLGLYYTSKVIKKFGGDINIKSKLDFGTEVLIKLPIYNNQ